MSIERLRYCLIVVGISATWGMAFPAVAQQIGIQTPFNTARDSFYERMGINFGFQFAGGRGPGSRIVGYNPLTQTAGGPIVFSQNGFGSAIPPFGGYDPNTSGRFGYAYVRPDGGGYHLGFELGQGSTRSLTNQTPSIVVQNGFGGSVFDGSFRPFVTGVIPVTGAGMYVPRTVDNAVTRAIQSGQLNGTYERSSGGAERASQRPAPPVSYSRSDSSAQHGDISVAEIKRQREKAAERDRQEYLDLVDQLAEAESSGQYRLARKLAARFRVAN